MKLELNNLIINGTDMARFGKINAKAAKEVAFADMKKCKLSVNVFNYETGIRNLPKLQLIRL